MPDGSKVILNKKEKVQREAIAKQLLTPSPDPHQQNTCKVVRHINFSILKVLHHENDYSKYYSSICNRFLIITYMFKFVYPIRFIVI